MALAIAACADSVGPRVTGEDTLRPAALGHDVLGGKAALEALRVLVDSMTAQGRLDEVPVNALELLRSTRDDPASEPAPRFSTSGSSSITGPHYINGIAHYEENGEYYPPAGTTAKVRTPYTTGFLNGGTAVVNAGFAFDGHGGSQRTTWQVKHSRTGEPIAGSTFDPFGSVSRRFLSTSGTVAGHATIRGLPQCDVSLSASSTHNAWYDGSWISSLSINLVGMISITIIRTRDGLSHGGSKMYEHVVHCLVSSPGDDCDFEPAKSTGRISGGSLLETIGSARLDCGGGGPGGGGSYFDEPSCWACQQWFWYENGKIVEEWWECHEVDGWRCGLAT